MAADKVAIYTAAYSVIIASYMFGLTAVDRSLFTAPFVVAGGAPALVSDVSIFVIGPCGPEQVLQILPCPAIRPIRAVADVTGTEINITLTWVAGSMTISTRRSASSHTGASEMVQMCLVRGVCFASY
jgi:hypothetical protein